MRFVSPLRYPGGKAALADFLGVLISSQRPRCSTYVEPYAGGAGAALRLLRDEYVDEVVLNDLDPGVAAFWRTIFDQPDDVVDRIATIDLSIEEWSRQREIYCSATGTDFELGFATFYLNRTNRSGILDARPIGGMNQAGKWKIDARFNRSDLIDRIRVVSRFRNRVRLVERDATDLLREMLPEGDSSFFYVDPPYTDKGEDLYLNDLTWDDHAALAEVLVTSNQRWLVTYNQDPRIPAELYPQNRCVQFDIKHTAQNQHVGSEFAIFSQALTIDSVDGISVGSARFVS